MQSVFTNALSKLLSQHTGLSASRRETFAWLVLLMLRQGSVCLWRLAAHVSTPAQLSSVHRRFYRFFQYVTLDGAAAARIAVGLLGLEGKPWVLAMDRTNWDFGRATINFLMISVEWNGIGIPLVWKLLPKTGNSSTAERIALFDRLAEIFPDMKIATLTGDREFIGDAWMNTLAERKIPFVLRLRENQHVQRQGFATMTIAAIAAALRAAAGKPLILKQLCKLGRAGNAPAVRIVILRLSTGELLALATPAEPRKALARTKARWRDPRPSSPISNPRASTLRPPISPTSANSRPSWRCWLWPWLSPPRPAPRPMHANPSPSKSMAAGRNPSSDSAEPSSAKPSLA